MVTSLNQRTRQRWILVGCLFALCSFLAGLSVLQTYIYHQGSGQPTLWGPLVRQEFKDWYASGITSLGAIWFASRIRLQPNRTRRWLSIHGAAALVFAGIYAVSTAWLVAGEPSVMHPGQILTFSHLIRTWWLHYVVAYLIMYWIVVLGHLGWHSYCRNRERELETAELLRDRMLMFGDSRRRVRLSQHEPQEAERQRQGRA